LPIRKADPTRHRHREDERVADTIFGKIARGEAQADVVYEDDRALAFRDVAPQAPVHLLVVPRKPIEKLADAGAEDEALLGHLLRVASRVAAEAGLEDWRLVVNNGAGAGQTVFHLHVHVLGGRPMRWPPG
jgi:histidine triad (HIT) family protein